MPMQKPNLPLVEDENETDYSELASTPDPSFFSQVFNWIVIFGIYHNYGDKNM
jgi:hypothetical protein